MDDKDLKPTPVKSWKELGHDFTQETTFHGWRFITDLTSYKCRRFLWLLAVLGVLGFFFYIFVESLTMYLKHPKSVTVEIRPVDNISFPSVTICNQNFAKITSAYKNNILDILEKVYGETSDTNKTSHFPENGFLIRTSTSTEINVTQTDLIQTIGQTSLKVCTDVCTENTFMETSANCGSMMFDLQDHSCYLLTTLQDDVLLQIAGSLEFPASFLGLNDSRELLLFVDSLSDIDDSNWYNIYDTAYDARKAFVDSSHSITDMVIECTWSDEVCSEPIEETVTDYGVCFTFNPDGHSLYTSYDPGVASGLHFTLNIEEYEYMLGPQSDAGIKVYVYEPGGVASIKDLGFSIEPGTHSLVSISATKTSLLGHPYGDCQQNKTFENSLGECQLKCETQALFDICGCVDIYQQDVIDQENVCSIQDYFQCVIKMRYSAVNDTHRVLLRNKAKQCEADNCLSSCLYHQYKPQISTAGMSRLSMSQILDSKLKDKLMEDKKSSINIRRRVDSSAMKTFLDVALSTKKAYKTFLDGLFKYGGTVPQEKLTPQSMVVLKSLFSDLFIHDFDNIIFNDLSETVKLLSIYIKPTRDALYELVDSVINDFKVALFYMNLMIHEAQNVKDVSEMLLNTQDTLYNAYLAFPIYTKMVKNLTNVFDSYEIQLPENLNVPQRLAPWDSYCEEYSNEFLNALEDLEDEALHLTEFYEENTSALEALYNGTIDDLPDDILDLYLNVSSTIFRLLSTTEESYQNLRARCLDTFFDIVENVNKIKSNMDSENNKLSITVSYNIALEVIPIIADSSEFAYILDMFLSGSYSAIDLDGELLSSSVISKWKSKITTAIDNLTLKITQVIQKKKDEVLNSINSAYQSIITGSKAMSPLYEDGVFPSRLNNMALWKSFFGAFSLNDSYLVSQSIREMLSGDEEMYTIILEGEGLDYNEMVIDGEEMELEIISIQTSSFVDVVDECLNAYGTLISELKVNMISQLERLDEQILKFKSEYNSIDRDFMLQNLIGLDIYFSEIKKEFVKEVPTYTIVSLLGNIGGYMGLLLGASILTILEVLDFFIYNIVRKCLARKLERKVDNQFSLKNID